MGTEVRGLLGRPRLGADVARRMSRLLGRCRLRPATDLVGARGVGAMARLLLGSVAEGTLAHAAIPVPIVK
jgi:hypothetical protein